MSVDNHFTLFILILQNSINTEKKIYEKGKINHMKIDY